MYKGEDRCLFWVYNGKKAKKLTDGLTFRHLCDDWSFQEKLRKERRKTPAYFKTVQHREQEVEDNPNSLSCFGSPLAYCERRCPHYELCESVSDADGCIVIVEEE